MGDHVGNMKDHLRFHRKNADLHGTFGSSGFGVVAEKIARFLGTPKYIGVQTVLIILWMIYNGYAALHVLHGKPFDPYPWILLNLVFSTQAAYAAPLILLAQTRAAARDKAAEESDAQHREAVSADHTRQLTKAAELAALQVRELQQNTGLTRTIQELQVEQMMILDMMQGDGSGRPHRNPYIYR